VRSTGNLSTERAFMAALRSRHVAGWRLRPSGLPGNPDFYFPRKKLLVFLDGCFWHGCPRCYRAPSSHRGYWRLKIERNKERDRRVLSELRGRGFRVIRIWEHDILQATRFERVLRRLKLARAHSIK